MATEITKEQILDALYDVLKKIEACKDWRDYSWMHKNCALCGLFYDYDVVIDNTSCKGRCPMYPCSIFRPFKHKSLQPLTDAVERAIMEIEGKQEPSKAEKDVSSKGTPVKTIKEKYVDSKTGRVERAINCTGCEK